MEQNEPKKLSIISYVIIFLCIIVVTILLIQKLDVTAYSDLGEESSILISNNLSDLISEENKLYIKSIKADYGIDILYGKDVETYATNVNAIAQYDKNIINNNLKVIYSALKKYPINIFNIFKSKDYPMYIMLVDKFNNDNLALASKNTLNVFRLYVSNTDNFERAFHHEMYHILEYYMLDKDKYIYSSWYNLNPIGFKYNENIDYLTTEYVYTKNKNESGYFITKYSKATEKEDRAELFAELMIANKKPDFLESTNILNKVLFLKNILVDNLSKNSFYFYNYLG